MRRLWRFLLSRPVVSGVVIALLGLGLVAEGAWLIAVGGDWFYVFEGVFYLAVGGLLVAGLRLALWVNFAILVATVVWAFLETGLTRYAVFGLLPRLDLAMLISVYLVMPWVWLRLRPLRGTRQLPTWRRLALPVVPALIALALLLTGIVNIISIPHLPAPAGGNRIAAAADFGIPSFGVKPGNWAYYGRTPGGSRFSPLTQITPANVSHLKKVWSYQSGDLKHASGKTNPEFDSEATPTAINGVVYSCTPNGWVFALNGITGKQIWKYKQTRVNDSADNLVNCRGVAYYKAPPSYQGKRCKTRIIAPTGGPYIAALDARTGKVCKNFGHDGMINLKQHMGGVAPGSLVQSSEPLVMDGLIYTGGNVKDSWFKGEPSGVVRAWSAVTGKLAWHWDLGKKKPNAPLKPGQIYTPYTPNAWGTITGDPKLGIIYVPLGNATPDFYGKFRRPFDYKYSGSVVALDAKTGHELWHFQQARKDVFDYDLPIGPSLINWPNGHGGTIPALIQTSKRGLLFVLDRKTGKPLFPIAQEPSGQDPPGGVMQHWLSKTQPIQPAMPSFEPRLTETDMWGLTPYDQIWCRVQFHKLYYDGPATPPTLRGSIMYPTFDGVIDWYGAALDPSGNLVAVINHLPYVGRLIPRAKAPGKGKIKRWKGQGEPPPDPDASRFKPQYGLPYAMDIYPFLSPIGAPCDGPPWATLAAVNLVTKKVVWTMPMGDSRHTAPLGIKENLPLPTGVFTLGGDVITRSGVIFVAGSADDMIRAYDEASGRILWQYALPAGGQATPAIYRGRDGREYLVVTAGGHEGLGTKRGDYTIAFALPRNAAQPAR